MDECFTEMEEHLATEQEKVKELCGFALVASKVRTCIDHLSGDSYPSKVFGKFLWAPG